MNQGGIIMIKTNNNTSSTFSERLRSGAIKCYKTPNHGDEFFGYREKVSLIGFEEYLYSLRCINDFRVSGGEYLGY